MRRHWPLVVFPTVKLIVHLVTLRGYGFFRDEFYYIACSDRLAFGYVDHPPLSILLLRVVRELLGESIGSIRLVPALAGSATVLLVGLMVRNLGGGRSAEALAMAAAIAAPVYLSLNHFYSMNALDVLFWTLAALIVIRMAKEEFHPGRWLILGVVLGLGLQNKISVLWLGFGLFVGILATPRRRALLTPWPWAGGLIALALFSPHVLWQVDNGWPTIEFIRNATQEKMLQVSLGAFLRSQFRMMNLVTAPVWAAGLVWLLAGTRGRPFRVLGWTYLAVFALLAVSGSSRAGYLAPAYTWLLAAGGISLEGGLALAGRPWLVRGLVAVLLAGGAMRAPFGLPVLPVESYVAYARAMGVAPSTAEKKDLADLPQFYADMHGWEEIVSQVAEVHRSLRPEERSRAAVFTFNYGVAGAVEFLGRKHGLPVALSGHNNYWLWGPQGAQGEVVIIVGGEEADHDEVFWDVTRAATIECGRCMPYENRNPVWVCRGPRTPLTELWPRLKHFD
jgi:hypothetical protein